MIMVIIIMGHECERGMVWRGKEWILKEKRIDVCYIYTHEDSTTKPTKHSLKERGGEGEDGNTMEGVNLFKVHCTYVWSYYNEVP
jgi:hypothetical protein